MRNRLIEDEQGKLRPKPTDDVSDLAAGLVLRAVGYRVRPLPELPFDNQRGVVENRQGRITHDGRVVTGAYVAGWAKRGCRGIIGTNKKCARETVQNLLQDVRGGHLSNAALNPDGVMREVQRRKADAVLLSGWLSIDQTEKTAGHLQGRPRIKITNRADMLKAALRPRISK
ncbi:hypothetical protein [Rhodococcus koreensis]|uniref:hypothetical protein n=1 Tax=Rhodococcus koreensis TaxID=99653 RepID=UPI003670464B